MSSRTILPIFLPLPEAARKYGVSEARLKTMIDNGKIKAAMIGEQVIVPEEEVQNASLRKEDLPEYKRHAHLKGNPIWVTEAARKYAIPQPTISRWVKGGIIKQIGMDGKKTLLDEADVAYCAAVYHSGDPKQGRRLFDGEGRPRKPKTGPLVL
jgi:excisionase family DNA binding protein